MEPRKVEVAPCLSSAANKPCHHQNLLPGTWGWALHWDSFLAVPPQDTGAVCVTDFLVGWGDGAWTSAGGFPLGRVVEAGQAGLQRGTELVLWGSCSPDVCTGAWRILAAELLCSELGIQVSISFKYLGKRQKLGPDPLEMLRNLLSSAAFKEYGRQLLLVWVSPVLVQRGGLLTVTWDVLWSFVSDFAVLTLWFFRAQVWNCTMMPNTDVPVVLQVEGWWRWTLPRWAQIWGMSSIKCGREL